MQGEERKATFKTGVNVCIHSIRNEKVYFWSFVSLMTSRYPMTNKLKSEVMQVDLFKKCAGFDIFVSNCSFKRHQMKKLMFK